MGGEEIKYLQPSANCPGEGDCMQEITTHAGKEPGVVSTQHRHDAITYLGYNIILYLGKQQG